VTRRAPRALLLAALLAALAAVPARSAAPSRPATHDRVRVYSLQELDGGDTGERIAHALLSVPGIRRASFDLYSAELALVLDRRVGDEQVPAMIGHARPGVRAILGSGRGRYLPPLDYPPGADVAVLTRDGSAVGPLGKLRAPHKTTIFDVYADWCIACRPLDAHLRAFVRSHPRVAIRKLNLARWDSPLAREFGPRLTALPHVLVVTPDGNAKEFDGLPWEEIAQAMGW
jgi:hypothetical protein